MLNKEDSITATEMAKLGGCQLRMIHEWGHTGVAEGPKNAYSEKARVRGIKIHEESERQVEQVFSERPAERAKRNPGGVIVVVAIVIAAASVAVLVLG